MAKKSIKFIHNNPLIRIILGVIFGQTLFTKECINKASLLKISPKPLFDKEGDTPLNPLLIEGKYPSLW